MDGTQVLVGLDADTRPVVTAALAGLAEPVYFRDLPAPQRAEALARCPALLTLRPQLEIGAQDWPDPPPWRFVQLLSAGADHVDFSRFPPGCTVCCNAGGFAEPMAEHVLAMALALCKKLLPNHQALRAGEFNQFADTGTLRDKVCGILGYGGIGRATAQLMRRMEMRIHALNRSGAADEAVDHMFAAHDLEAFLRSVDVLVICLPLTRHTHGLLGARELGWLKPDAMLINVARGEIVDEAALYEHLRTHPRASAGIDAWWVEPFRHGAFRMDHAFLDLPNVLGSPHNSPRVPGWGRVSLQRACANLARWLRGEAVHGRLTWSAQGVE
jgi:phosphoglycerate dehydrogenase-like enzyme